MDDDVVVRTALPEDLLPAAQARLASWRVAYAGKAPQDVLDGLDPAADAQRWAAWLDQHPGRLLVVARDGDVLGQALWGEQRVDDAHPVDADAASSEGTAEIYAFYVHPGAWRSGLGSALMAGTLDTLTHRRFRDVSLWVLEDNPSARAFYARHGFVETGEAVPAHFPGHREVRYRRSLVD